MQQSDLHEDGSHAGSNYPNGLCLALEAEELFGFRLLANDTGDTNNEGGARELGRSGTKVTKRECSAPAAPRRLSLTAPECPGKEDTYACDQGMALTGSNRRRRRELPLVDVPELV